VDAFMRPLADSLDNRLTWLHGLCEARPALRELRWMWGYARKVGKPKAWPVNPQLKASLSELVRARLPELHVKGVLRFIDGDEDIWG